MRTGLVQKFKDWQYRHSYVSTHTRHFLARQMRELRGDMSQAEFGNKLGMKQNVISRLENPTYGRFTLSTLLEVAKAMDLAVIVRFVDFPTFLALTEDQSDGAACPASFADGRSSKPW